MKNIEYEHGYNMGYDYIQYEGGSQLRAKRELLSRGIPLRSVHAVAFMKAIEDYRHNIPRRYKSY